MAIVAGVNIPDAKRVEIALTSIYGIGPSVALDIVNKAGIIDNKAIESPLIHRNDCFTSWNNNRRFKNSISRTP